MLIAKTALILALMAASVAIEPWLLIRADQLGPAAVQPITYRQWLETQDTQYPPGADPAL